MCPPSWRWRLLDRLVEVARRRAGSAFHVVLAVLAGAVAAGAGFGSSGKASTTRWPSPGRLLRAAWEVLDGMEQAAGLATARSASPRGEFLVGGATCCSARSTAVPSTSMTKPTWRGGTTGSSWTGPRRPEGLLAASVCGTALRHPLRGWRPQPSGTGRVPTERCITWPRSGLPESVDLILVPCPVRVAAHAQSFVRRQAEHADLALVGVGVHVEHGLTGLGQRVDLR